MKLRINGIPDMRYGENKAWAKKERKELIKACLLAVLLAFLVASAGVTFLSRPKIFSEPLEFTPAPTSTPTPKPRSYYEADPLRYLRYRGEELGLDQYEITRFITLFTRCENSGLNPEAININNDKHRSMDVGIAQINMYWHRDRVKLIDMLDPVKNIDFAYKLYQEQGLTPWTCARVLGYIK